MRRQVEAIREHTEQGAILVGGGLFGVYGMFLGAPVYAIIATILNELINKNYDKKSELE